MLECVRKIHISSSNIQGLSVSDGRAVIWSDDGIVTVLNTDTLKTIYETQYTDGSDLREVFFLPPFGLVLHGFNEMEIFSEASGELLDYRYNPVLDAIDASFPISASCNIIAREWQSSLGRYDTTSLYTFIAPETLERFHSLNTPEDSSLRKSSIREDGSIVISCGNDSSIDLKKYAIKKFHDVYGQSWAFIDRATLGYSELNRAVREFSWKIVGSSGEVFSFKYSKRLLHIADQAGVFSGTYDFPEMDEKPKDHLILKKGNLLFLLSSGQILHLDMLQKKASKTHLPDAISFSKLSQYPNVIVKTSHDEGFIYNIREREMSMNSFSLSENTICSFMDENTLLTFQNNPTQYSLLDIQGVNARSFSLKGLERARGFSPAGNEQIWLYQNNDLYQLNIKDLKESLDGS